jgi:hypothetical protein
MTEKNKTESQTVLKESRKATKKSQAEARRKP